jgi:hypothetical protein
MKAAKRQAKRLPVPDGPTLELRLDSGRVIVLDRLPDTFLPPTIGTTPRAAYAGDGYVVSITRSIHPEHGQLLHAVISHRSNQLPDWYVMKALKQAVFPDNVAAMLPLPEASAYVNIAECLHIVQTPSDWVGL